MQFFVIVANSSHLKYAISICEMMEAAANVRGTGIAKRKPEYIQKKMNEGHAIIALDNDKVIGFCYIESWENERYVANSGLITHPEYRKMGLAKAIKKSIFELSKDKFPNAKLFGITTSMAVMKINSDLGYKPVTFSELTKDEKFWNGCHSCTNYDILERTNRTMCICTGMICEFNVVPAKIDELNEMSSWKYFMLFLKNRTERIKVKAKQFPSLIKFLNNEK